jgi:hypothetical protein
MRGIHHVAVFTAGYPTTVARRSEQTTTGREGGVLHKRSP